MIELKQVTKSFGDKKVLDGIDLTINDREITVVLGRSGEGKSVMLKNIIGIYRPDSGTILINGVDIVPLSMKKKTALIRKIGMLFQDVALFDSMNVFDNVAFPLVEHTALSKKEIEKKVLEGLERVGLNNIEKKFPSQISGGMKKRVGIARALMLEPDVIIFDEPTSGLDPIMTASIGQLILEQKHSGYACLVISHDIEASFAIADKIAFLHQGRIRAQGSVEDIRGSRDPYAYQFTHGLLDGPIKVI